MTTARDALSSYIASSQALIVHIHTLFDAYNRVYSSLGMATPEAYTGLVTPTVANFDGLTGTVLLVDGTRVNLMDLENPKAAAERLYENLAEDIERQADALIRLRKTNGI